MNKKEIINILEKYKFDKDKYLVISGAAMVLLGIKENTNDIDIVVAEKYFDYLLKNYNCTFEKINKYNKEVYFIDDIINFSTTYYEEDKYFVENIPVQQPEKILKLKRNLNRKKDINDIRLIEEYLNE